jgi:hypothetical protein
MQTSFQKFCITKIPREDNEKADHLARMASAEHTETKEDREHSDWRKEIIDYLHSGALPSEKRSAVQLRMKAERFTIVNGTLYKRGFTLPLLKCVSPKEGNYILRKIHEEICGSHSGARVLAHKAVRAGSTGLT